MRYKHFKNADADISALTVGTWGIAGANSAGVTWGDVDTEESIAAIRQMIDNGVNMVDTAPIYGDGHSETVVGQALKDGYREKVYLATKFGSYISHYTGKSVRDNKYNSVEREIDESLARLQTDYIDFYIMHWPDENTPIEETMAVCNMLKKKGKIRYIGMSNSSKELIQEAQKYAKIDVIQPPFSIVNQSERELMEWAETQGIGTMTYGSLGGGILTGAIRELPKPDPIFNLSISLSINAISSLFNCHSNALQFSSACAGVLTPVNAVPTKLFWVLQLMDTCATGTLCASAILSNVFNNSITLENTGSLKNG